MTRIATALVLVPVVTWLILKGPDWAFIAALAAIALVAFYEYDSIVEGHRIARGGIPAMIAGLALLLAPASGAVAVLATLLAMTVALRTPNLSKALEGGAAFILGVLYIFGSWRVAIDLHSISHHWLMFAMLVSWVGDTGALYIGKPFGRHKLAPRVSPGKSWEGAAGSLITGVAAAVVYAHYLLPPMPVAILIVLAAAGNVAGQMGDLCESALKRGANIKDSGSMLPGHGGWLDRIDSCLFSVPIVYAFLKFWILR